MTGPYRKNGSGTLWTPNKDDNPEDAEKVLDSLQDSIKPENVDEPWLGGYNPDAFKLDEMYVDSQKGDKTLQINGTIENIFLGLTIPIRNNDEMQKIVKELNKVVTIDKESSGLYLKPGDFSEVRKKTADGQGRLNLGKEYAGEDVRLVILDD